MGLEEVTIVGLNFFQDFFLVCCLLFFQHNFFVLRNIDILMAFLRF